MRFLILGSVLAATLMSAVGSSRAEVVYPWCAYYGRTTRNCGFTSFQQCLATAQGSGASCERNSRYDAPLVPGDRKARRAD
jgi:hypothetical protein